MLLTRRQGIIGAFAGLVCAPAIVRSEMLMPVRQHGWNTHNPSLFNVLKIYIDGGDKPRFYTIEPGGEIKALNSFEGWKIT
jgi:hypothetical protein